MGRDPIPAWILVLTAVIAAILAFQSLSAYVEPAWAYGAFADDTPANQQVIATLGGRNVVMLVITLVALVRREARLLWLTFVMHFAREAQDMLIVPYFAGFATPAGLGQFATFLFLFLIPEGLAVAKLDAVARGDRVAAA